MEGSLRDSSFGIQHSAFPVRRLLLLITDLEIGGSPTVVRELAIRLRESGRVEVEVACLSRWGPVVDELKTAGVSVTPLNAGGIASFPVTLFRLVRLIRAGRFNTVFSFLIHANLMAALSSAFFPDVRYLQSIQTTQPNPRWHWWVQRFIHVAADAIVVPSPSVKRMAREWANVPAECIVVIPNAVDVASFNSIALARRVPIEPFQVGFIGRLDPIKRVNDLVESMCGLRLDAHLHIFGDGSERRALEQQIQRLGLNCRVTMHGAVRRPHEALAAIDVLVLPSDAEGFGLVLIEAMAAGVPVVATRVPGIQDVVTDQRTGILVPARCPESIQDAVTLLCTTPELVKSLTTAARADVRRRYGWDAVLRQYLSLLGVNARKSED